MINNLYIKNFRIFNELQIDRIFRVNLFVGKNNAGKSCLLEALQIYATKGNPGILNELVSTREEDWHDFKISFDGLSISNIDSPFRFLFNGYHFPKDESGAIEIGPLDNINKRIKILPRVFQLHEDEDGRIIRKPIKYDEIEQLGDVEIGLELQEGNEKVFLTSLISNRRRYSTIRRVNPYESFDNLQVVPAYRISNKKVAKLWDSVNLTQLEEEVIRCLQLIEPNISKIALVGNFENTERERDRIPVIRYSNNEERIPLKSMGDGMTRLFHIILSLVNARNGYLLIDEFENGLHWSVQEGLWKIIFELSEHLNVQVFITTHNSDCINSFRKVWSKMKDVGTFHRIDKVGNKINVIRYEYENLSDAIDVDVEVR